MAIRYFEAVNDCMKRVGLIVGDVGEIGTGTGATASEIFYADSEIQHGVDMMIQMWQEVTNEVFSLSLAPRLVSTATIDLVTAQREYALPGDLIAGARALFITTSSGGRPVTGWEKIGNKIQTNYESIWIDYQYDVSEDALPQYFVQLLKYFLCWHFAEPVTDQISKSQYWSNMAVGSAMDNGRGGYFRQASMIDSQNQPNQVIEDYSLVAVRY